jgi:sialate O-acetylesterase
MDFPLGRAVGGERAASELSRSTHLRLCNRTGSPGGAARRLEPKELEKITVERFFEGTWQVASPEVATRFSAVGFFFGRELSAALEVPVGLIDVSVGGSSTEGWVPLERLAQDPVLAPLAADYLATQLSHPFIRERTTLQLGNWVEAGRPEPRPRHFFEPGFLFESAITTLAPFRVKGVLWYQGEANAHLPQVADQLFRLMVEEWRRVWVRSDLPIHYVQLPGMGRPTWPDFRAVQAGWLDDPDLGMAVAIDVGHPTDVHPKDKQPVGERLARLALAKTYGRDVLAFGPVPTSLTSLTRDGDRLRIAFENAEGLRWADDRGPTGFEVAGEDRRFHPARARIQGNRVILSSLEVPRPTRARYAWAPFPEWSLINEAGLPAAPFRTED